MFNYQLTLTYSCKLVRHSWHIAHNTKRSKNPSPSYYSRNLKLLET